MSAVLALTIFAAFVAVAIDRHERRRDADRRRHDETRRILRDRYREPTP